MLRKIAFGLALALTLAFGVILTNQILQLADLAARVDPTFGQGVFWTLVLILAAAFAVPLALFLRLPRALQPPATTEGPEFEAHLEALRRRLTRNRLLKDRPLASREEIEAALAVLDVQATDAMKRAGSRAFLTTAVSQNGALDALVVLGIQARLVWETATIYSQRPGLREMAYLYSNVLTTAFISGELDDADMAEAMEPALSAVLGSAAGLIPGLQVASNLFVNSVLSGTANAFLTLRVGVIAREYSRAWTAPSRGPLRRLAIAQAGAMLGGIVIEGAAKISSAIGRGAGRALTGAVTGTGKAVSGAVTGTGKRIAATGAAIRDKLLAKQPDPTD
ncbi:MAG TPA: DUF697 domain-containing protein [Longimicrobiales bacterium]|nr:DUF697 domain-containing protein [Longimicrobiales bacterium]